MEWTLPARCPVNPCGHVISAENLLVCPVLDGNLRQVECPYCHNIFQHTPKRVKGDPRNLAYDVKSHCLRKPGGGERWGSADFLQTLTI